MTSPLLRQSQIDEFRRNGVLVIPRVYDAQSTIKPIQRGVYDVIGLLIKEYALDIDRPAFSPDQIDAGYQQLIAADRAYGGEVYDAVKQIPAFMRLVSAPLHSNMRPEFVERVIEGVTSYFS